MLLTPENADHKWHLRPDGAAKVTGTLQYLTDLSFPGMLIGKVLRSPHPHAEIVSINTEKARSLKGVQAVLTHLDVPGMNRFGIVIPDQPVFCEDRVRFLGDAICAVAADTAERAEEALRLVEVDFKPLPVVGDMVAAMSKKAPTLHPQGNVLHQASHHQGDIEAAFESCSVVVEETYKTPRQMHAYLETEGGVVVPDEDGGVTVYMGSQHGLRDRQQLARILALPQDRIRVVSSPMGGSFGGKDELNLQPYAALLALSTGRPVKMHNTRAESVRAGLKRHPMTIHMRTGADAQGHILAHQVSIVADTGAYATLGPAVLDFTVEHATGPYRMENVSIHGVLVYTNNSVAGEFRGFGGNQVTFALEGQLDRLAHRLGIDEFELRRLNLRREDDRGPLGQRVAATDGAAQVLEILQNSPLLHRNQQRSTLPTEEKPRPSESGGPEISPSPFLWKRRGTGVALTMHGCGLGFGRPDMAGGRLALLEDGRIELAFGLEEVGQGLLSVILHVAMDELECGQDDLCIRIGDTRVVPVSGSTTASRATYVVCDAIRRMKPVWISQMLEEASHVLNVPVDRLKLGPAGVWYRQSAHAGGPHLSYHDLAKRIKSRLPVTEVYFPFPTTPDAVVGAHYLYTFAGVSAEVEVDLQTGQVKVLHLYQAVSAGPVVNPMGYLGQIEGGGAMGLGFTLTEDTPMQDGTCQVANLDSYLIPTIADVPWDVGVEADENLSPDDPFGPRGVGEIGSVAVAPAIAAAVHDAVGLFVSHLPISAEEIMRCGLPSPGEEV